MLITRFVFSFFLNRFSKLDTLMQECKNIKKGVIYTVYEEISTLLWFEINKSMIMIYNLYKKNL